MDSSNLNTLSEMTLAEAMSCFYVIVRSSNSNYTAFNYAVCGFCIEAHWSESFFNLVIRADPSSNYTFIWSACYLALVAFSKIVS